MSPTYRPIAPITTHGFSEPVSALSFDPVSDILWAGSNAGSVTAYCGTQGVRGVSFRVGGDLAVKKISAGDSHVRAFGVAENGMGSWGKGGVNKWFYLCG